LIKVRTPNRSGFQQWLGPDGWECNQLGRQSVLEL